MVRSKSVWEIEVADLDHAREFYATVFGWSFEKKCPPGRIVVKSGKGPQILIRVKPSNEASCSPPLFIEVDDLDDTLEKAKKAGGKVFMRRKDVPNHGAYAMIQDRDHSCVGIFCKRF
jgi:uncharacterized protein